VTIIAHLLYHLYGAPVTAKGVYRGDIFVHRNDR